MIKRKKVTKIEITKTCDYCGLHEGEHTSDGGHTIVRKAKYWAEFYSKGWGVKPRPTSCKHDICSSCWYFPGDLIRCPKCNPDIDAARSEDRAAGRHRSC